LFLESVSFDDFVEKLMPFAVVGNQTDVGLVLIHVDQTEDRGVVDQSQDVPFVL
jgi:hypothetical protein